MRTVLFVISCILILNTKCYAQCYDKENFVNRSLNDSLYCFDFFNELYVVQKFPFGALEYGKEFVQYKKSKNKKVKSPYFKGDISYYANTVVNRITLTCKDVDKLKDVLVEKFGEPRVVKYVRMSSYDAWWANEYVFDIPDRFYISLKDNNQFSVYCLDYMKNTDKYDEFTQAGMSYFDFDNMYNLRGDDKIYLKPAYIYNKRKKEVGEAFIVEYYGENWMFLSRIDFLLENGDLLTYPLSPNNNVENLVVSSYCTEKDVVIIPPSDWEKIISSNVVKVKFTGEKFNIDFKINPVQKYAMKVAQYYYKNNLLLDN